MFSYCETSHTRNSEFCFAQIPETAPNARTVCLAYCEVTGAGLASANGRYYLDGLYAERPRYRHERDDVDLYIRQGGKYFRGFGITRGREPVQGHWIYFCTLSHNRDDLLDVPCRAEWVTHGGFGGIDPAPQVNVVYAKAVRWCLVKGAGCAQMNGRYFLDGEYRGKPRYKHELEEDLYIRQGGKRRSGYGITCGRETFDGRWGYFCQSSHNRTDLLDVPDNAIWVTHGGCGAVDPPPQVINQLPDLTDLPPELINTASDSVNDPLVFTQASSSCNASLTRIHSAEENQRERQRCVKSEGSVSSLPSARLTYVSKINSTTAEVQECTTAQASVSARSKHSSKLTSLASLVLPSVVVSSRLLAPRYGSTVARGDVSPAVATGAVRCAERTSDHVKRRAATPPSRRNWPLSNEQSRRGRSLPSRSRASPGNVRKAVVCSKCDGQHEDTACPHFPLPREKHKDAWTLASRIEPVWDDDACSFVRFARVIPQPGDDGSCLFHSLAYGLGEQQSGWSLRAEICEFIEGNPDVRIADNTLREWILYDAGMSVDEYCAHMSEGAWGGGIEMAAFATMKGVNVSVYERCSGGFQRISNFPCEFASKTVMVVYVGRGHYDALVVPN